jgi:hypothetical protein
LMRKRQKSNSGVYRIDSRWPSQLRTVANNAVSSAIVWSSSSDPGSLPFCTHFHLRQRRGESNADRNSEKTPDQIGSGVGSCLANVFSSRVHDHASLKAADHRAAARVDVTLKPVERQSSDRLAACATIALSASAAD